MAAVSLDKVAPMPNLNCNSNLCCGGCGVGWIQMEWNSTEDPHVEDRMIRFLFHYYQFYFKMAFWDIP